MERYDEAVDCHRDAVRLHVLAGNKWATGNTLTDLGLVHMHLAQFEDAFDALTQSMAVHDEADNHWGKASALTALGDALNSSGRPDAAREQWQLALLILDALNAPQASEMRARLDATN